MGPSAPAGLPVLGDGAFYRIRHDNLFYILEDTTKDGLAPADRVPDGDLRVDVERGIIYDMYGTGHRVPMRWYFPKESHGLTAVRAHADRMEKRYAALRDLACPG